jgi:uncharacterized protein YjbI with pentapeptide repeats
VSAIRSQMTDSLMTGSHMTGSQMTGSQMTGSQMTGSQMTGSLMTGSQMTGSHNSHTRMTGSHNSQTNGSHTTNSQMVRRNLSTDSYMLNSLGLNTSPTPSTALFGASPIGPSTPTSLFSPTNVTYATSTRSKLSENVAPQRDYFDHLPQYNPTVVNHIEHPANSRQNNKRYVNSTKS